MKPLPRSQPLVRQPQSFQWQVLVDVLDLGDQGGHQLSEATVGDDLHRLCWWRSWYFAQQATDETLHEANVSKDNAGLHVFDGVFAQSRTRCG